MIRFRLFCVVLFFGGCVTALYVNGSQSVLQRTVELLFSDRSHSHKSVADKMFRISPKQRKMCRRDPGLTNILVTAGEQAFTSCVDSFTYDRWNCSTVYNNKVHKRIFEKVYRENAFVHALMSASISHAVAKGCSSGELTKCSCAAHPGNKNTSWQFKRSGCSDDYSYGKRVTKNFLEIKKEAYQTGEILKHDVIVGIKVVASQMSEVCKCHGFSGSCTTKTCWKRLAPFNSAMGSLKKIYHHAVKRKPNNSTTKSTLTTKMKKKHATEGNKLIYLHKSPNLCWGTKKRECKHPNNCATLCCGRGYITGKRQEKTKCKCRMINCCFVQCDTCYEEVMYYVCK